MQNPELAAQLELVDRPSGAVIRPATLEEIVALSGEFHLELWREGELIWDEAFPNLVVTVGKNDLLDKYLAGSAYTAAFFLGLVDGGSTPTYAAGDTMASHAGWTENTGYSNATRPAPTWNAAAASSKASTATGFNINATGTIAGAFLTTVSTKGGTTGTLFSAGSFATGNRAVLNNDVLNVTYTLNA